MPGHVTINIMVFLLSPISFMVLKYIFLALQNRKKLNSKYYNEQIAMTFFKIFR